MLGKELYWFDLHTTMLKVSNEIVDNIQYVNVEPGKAEAVEVYVEAYNTLRGLWEKNANEADKGENSFEVDNAMEWVSYSVQASATLIFLKHILPLLPITAKVKDLPWREDIDLKAHPGNEGGYYLSVITESLHMMITQGISYPTNFESHEEWKEILRKMEVGLTAYLSEGIKAPAEENFNPPQEANNAMLLIHNWFGSLWD